MKPFHSSPPDRILERFKKALASLGYGPKFVREGYSYFDSLSLANDELKVIPLAAFAQDTPSYRNACIGVTTVNGLMGPDNVAIHRGLGAPIVFEVYTDEIVQWKVNGLGPPEVIDRFAADLLESRFEQNHLHWSPRKIFEGKTAEIQLDFVDAGLLPVIESNTKYKLEQLLQRTLPEIENVHKEATGQLPEDEDLFMFVFRFIAAKVLRDRNEPGGWHSDDAFEVLNAIESYYGVGPDKLPASAIQVRETIIATWAIISRSFHFENLSVYHLAYIWENTLVTRAKRNKYGIHSTPPHVAEYIVKKLPIEMLQAENRRVLEPCSGHGIFLLFAMQRLRDLLPLDLSHAERHSYLRDRLTGLEVDLFAREVSRICLMLADYPNPNGWRIFPDDVFASRRLEEEMLTADIVLCNPPFGKFSTQERNVYTDISATMQKPAELLNRVLLSPPSQLGFVLPKTFITGSLYKSANRQLANRYRSIEMVALPDNVFNHADQETVLLMAWDRGEKIPTVSVTSSVVTERGYPAFRDFEELLFSVTKEREVPANKARSFNLWVSQLDELWEFLSASPTLKDVAKIRRGIQWKPGVDRKSVISKVPIDDWPPGYTTTRQRFSQFSIRANAFINPDPLNMMHEPMKYDWKSPKTLVNAHASSRGVWRMSAVTEVTGALATQAFHVAFANCEKTSPEIVSAVLNGPVANAWVYSWSDKRDNKIDILKKVPFPAIAAIDQILIEEKVGKLEDLLSSEEVLQLPSLSILRHLLLQVDAAVMQAYGLPEDLENELLATFGQALRPIAFELGASGREEFEIAKAELEKERQQLQKIGRYHELVDQFLIKKPTIEQQVEIDRLGHEIDAYDAPYYEGILHLLESKRQS